MTVSVTAWWWHHHDQGRVGNDASFAPDHISAHAQQLCRCLRLGCRSGALPFPQSAAGEIVAGHVLDTVRHYEPTRRLGLSQILCRSQRKLGTDRYYPDSQSENRHKPTKFGVSNERATHLSRPHISTTERYPGDAVAVTLYKESEAPRDMVHVEYRRRRQQDDACLPLWIHRRSGTASPCTHRRLLDR